MTLPNWVSLGQERDIFATIPFKPDPRALWGENSDDPALPPLFEAWAKENKVTITSYDGTVYPGD